MEDNKSKLIEFAKEGNADGAFALLDECLKDSSYPMYLTLYDDYENGVINDNDFCKYLVELLN